MGGKENNRVANSELLDCFNPHNSPQSKVICGVWDSFSVLSTIHAKIIIHLWVLPTAPSSVIRLTYSRPQIYLHTYLSIYLPMCICVCGYICIHPLTPDIHTYSMYPLDVMDAWKFIILLFILVWRFEIFHSKKLKINNVFFNLEKRTVCSLQHLRKSCQPIISLGNLSTDLKAN